MKKFFLSFFIMIFIVYIIYNYWNYGIIMNRNIQTDNVIADEQNQDFSNTNSVIIKSQDVINSAVDVYGVDTYKLETNESSSKGTSMNGKNKDELIESKDELVEIKGLVELEKIDSSFVIDLKYATEDNFTGWKIYTKALCLIHKNTAKKLIAANNEFKELGYVIKIFDAYRPYSAQQILWDAAEDKTFLANPKKGSIHNRGAAVDVTLADLDGNEVEMPSSFDEFTKRARIDFDDCSQFQKENRELLARIMVKNGFKRISSEWWHFEDINAKNYPILDISFEEFSKE